MSTLNRRQWLQRSLLAGTGLMFTAQGPIWAKALQGINNPDHPLLKLNWNENPLGPPSSAVQAVIQGITEANRYPDPKIDALKVSIAQRNGLKKDQVMISAGSTELLSLLGQHVGLQKGEILTPWPSFPTLIRFGELCGAKIKKVDLGTHGIIDLNAIKENITATTTLVFICNPNNPTSTELPADDLIQFLKDVPETVLVCVDEAYLEYTQNGKDSSVVKLVDQLPNLIICRTFSKAYGLAGLRIGYALSQKQNIDALRTRHLGFEISAGLAPVLGAQASLDDEEFLTKCVTENQKGREILYAAFNNWGVDHYKSATNFVYAKSNRFDPQVVVKLREENILISQWPDIMTGHLRVSIGKSEEMEQFVASLSKYRV